MTYGRSAKTFMAVKTTWMIHDVSNYL